MRVRNLSAYRRKFAENPVLNPVIIPPFDGIHLHSIHLHAEVQVVAARQAGLPAPPDLLPLFHKLSRLYPD